MFVHRSVDNAPVATAAPAQRLTVRLEPHRSSRGMLGWLTTHLGKQLMSTNPVTLQQLVYFLSAVEHGSLSAAAEANYVAQPSLSEQIRRLEGQLGVTLFIRTNRQLILTDAARILVPHAERVIAAAQEAVTAVDPVRNLTGGTATLGTFSSAHHLIHVDLVSSFRERYPQVAVRIIELNSVQIADAVRSGEIEAGLVGLPVDDRGLDVGKVEWSTEAVYFSRDPSRVATPKTIEEAIKADLILPDSKWGEMDPTRHKLLARAQDAGLALRPVIEVESAEVALTLAQHGRGDAIVTLAVAHKLGMTDHLHWVSLDPPLRETFAFVTRRGARLSPGTTIMMQMARGLLRSLASPA